MSSKPTQESSILGELKKCPTTFGGGAQQLIGNTIKSSGNGHIEAPLWLNDNERRVVQNKLAQAACKTSFPGVRREKDVGDKSARKSGPPVTEREHYFRIECHKHSPLHELPYWGHVEEFLELMNDRYHIQTITEFCGFVLYVISRSYKSPEMSLEDIFISLGFPTKEMLGNAARVHNKNPTRVIEIYFDRFFDLMLNEFYDKSLMGNVLFLSDDSFLVV